MRALQRVILWTLVLTATMVLAPLAGTDATVHSPAAGSAVTSGTALTTAVSGSPASAATTAPNLASQMASHALAATAAAGLSPRVVSVPRPSASVAQVAQAQAVGHVTSLYTGIPAPVGLAYYGLSAGPGGSVVPSTLNTTSLWGQVDTNGAGIQPLDLFASSPDSLGIQLNAVAPNITLFGTPGYSFWTQNVVLYYAQANFMILVTNVWNFSGASISPNALYATGGSFNFDDFSDYGLLGYYYSELIIPFPVVQPFDLSLYMNSSIMDGRNAVTFTVGITSTANPSEDFTVPYDYVIFNSIASGGAPLTTPSNYTANGYSYNPIGLTDDYELILGGPNGGSQGDLAAADANLALAYWDATTNAYRATPSAYNYGGETGETVTGANVAWASGSGGPSGISRYGTMTTGPTILRGLWNAGAPKGSVPVTIAVTPSNAFDVFTPVNNTPALRNFLSGESIAAPGVYGDTFWMTPGTYRLSVQLSDYTPYSTTLTVTGAKTIVIHLQENLREGIYTPLWAFSNSQLRAISFFGSGTTWSPYVLFNNQRAPLSDVFGVYNDYVFPVFPGVFLYGTTASVALLNSASFTTVTNTFQYPGPYLPATNELQFWFWDVSHVALVDSTISGWFGSSAYYPVDWDSFNVVFYASSGNLIAGNHFATEGQALLMFSGGTIFGPVNVGGGNNTVWGNTFTEAATPSSTISVAPNWEGFNVGLGIELAEQNDLVYNNYFATPTTAWMLPLNLYSGDSFLYTDTWNIPMQSAFVPHWAAGFPLFPLFGSIVGSRDQGGNFWWDYGNSASNPNPYNGAVNPAGSLPYNENASTVNAYSLTPYGGTLLLYIYGIYQPTFIYNGGDFAPLEPPAHHHW